MKKKQQDFQKVKLKVGKHLPKGRNETRTSFQTRKINLREQIKETTDEPTLKELLSFMKSSDVKTKYYNLRKLLKYVSANEDTLFMYFPDILKELGRSLQESDAEIRSQAISVLGQCSEILTDIEFKSFVVPLISYLNCMMTHITFRIKQDSLKFLDVLLSSHPNVICQSSEIPISLLNMISCKESSTGKKGKSNKDERKLVDVITSKMSADEWRLQVLERMLTFFSGMLSEKNSTEMISDDKEIYWDAQDTLYLPLYLNSGSKPAKFDYSLYTSMSSEGSNSINFKKFILELISILSAILKSFSGNRSFSESNISYLSTITQILCYTGEWAIQNLDLDDDLNPAQKLISVSIQLLEKFPYEKQAGKSTKTCDVECVHLNLGIGHLYCMCSFLTDIPGKSHVTLDKLYLEKWELIKMYLVNVFQVSGAKMSEKSISLSLKMCKISIQCTKLDESAKNGFLVALLGALDTNRFSSIATEIYALFMNLSLDYEHRNLLNTQAMRIWFQSLIKNLNFMLESKKFIPNYLDYIKQVCSRRNPYFMETLKSLPQEKFREFLKFPDVKEDFHLTILHLIVSLDEISPDCLQDLAEIIRDESFPLKTAFKFIRILNSRFSKSFKVFPLLDQMNFVKFLLNLGCDSFLIYDSSLDTNPLPLTEKLLNHQKNFGCHYEVYATSNSERHQEIFKVCLDCLLPFLKVQTHAKCLMYFIRTIFDQCVKCPMHSVVAIVELFKRCRFMTKDPVLVEYLQTLMYSCLLHNSVVTNDVKEDEWNKYCVPAVQNCLDFVDSMDIFAAIDNNVHNFEDTDVYYALRILMFLMQRRCFEELNKKYMYLFFCKMKKLDSCSKFPVLAVMVDNMIEYIKNF